MRGKVLIDKGFNTLRTIFQLDAQAKVTHGCKQGVRIGSADSLAGKKNSLHDPLHALYTLSDKNRVARPCIFSAQRGTRNRPERYKKR